jgi:hypothetical protein
LNVRSTTRLLIGFLCAASIVTGCGGNSASSGSPAGPSTPAVVVTPASTSITTAQSLSVTIAVSGSAGTPTGSVSISTGSFASSAIALTSGSATITIPAGSLAVGSDTLTAVYTSGTATYNNASGTATITVAQAVTTPKVTVTPASSSITTTQSLSVAISVSGSAGTPTGSVSLSSGSFASSATPLNSGSAAVTIPAGSLVVGSDTLTATYTPNTAASAVYTSASGTATVDVTQAGTSVTISIDTLANRHQISPYIYGQAYPASTSQITDSGLSLVRWGGNGTSTYNWQLQTNNAANDYYFEDYGIGGFDSDSTQFITDVETAGSHPLMTMPMLNWVAQSPENGSNGHWSYSVATYGPQCSVDQYNTDAGDGLKTDCQTPITTLPVTSAYFPLLDDTTQACPTGDCVYREPWAQALATAFGTATCPLPYSPITSCHYYDMDNEIDIWSGTHRDVHPDPSGYDELANTYETEAAALKTWDPAAVRFGPVFCCWYFYWNGADSRDKATHGGVDFLPWWLNQVYWMDQINGSRTLDVFDVHAYPDADTTGLSTAQLQALSADVYRDYWDPALTSPGGVINQIYATSMQPNRTIAFRIPRMKAMVNAIYPGTPLAFTEWSAAFNGEADFSTALGDADAFGLFGREGMAFASRWGGPDQANPNYQALKLYTNYDGAHHGFGTVSVSDSNTGNPNLFSSFAALNAAGTTMTIMVSNKDPRNPELATLNLSGFTASSYIAYTLASTSPSAITASKSQAWNASQTFAPYSITLLVVTGTQSTVPPSEWYLNPDDLMIPAAGKATLRPAINSGTTPVTLSSAAFDAFEGASACTGSIALTNATITPSQPATITVTAPGTPGFCHYTVTGSDGTAPQTQGGWIIVGQPPATLTQTGSNQSASAGATLSQPLTVTLNPGQSAGLATGAGILFTTSAGTLSNGTTSGTSVIATTNASGTASVTLTLPPNAGPVAVTAQDQFALGGASVTFTATAN